jgi:hypothetical protein
MGKLAKLAKINGLQGGLWSSSKMTIKIDLGQLAHAGPGLVKFVWVVKFAAAPLVAVPGGPAARKSFCTRKTGGNQ